MKQLAFLIALYVIIFLGQHIIESKRWTQSRIIGGKDASVYQFPYVVSIQEVESGHHSCGGSIIDSRWILTAAHCVASLSGSVQGPTQLRVMVGSVSLSEATTYYSISKIVPHSKFMFNILKADIALLQTDKEIQFTTTVQRIDLQTEPLVKVKAFVCGWGILGRDRTLPDRLQYLDTEILPLATCNKLLEKHGVTPADKSQICDLSGKQRQSSKGDSGSPLVSNGKQIGLVSYGVYGTAIPSVNTNVSYFYDWIQETISGNSYMLNTKHKGNTFETQTVF